MYEQISEARKEQAMTSMFNDTAVIVSGDALLKIASHEALKDQFLELTDGCSVVIACRVSPK